ncbi:unnamed protein product [[Candida] boidinii]|nr:hypothetical protein B5S33_g2420 [[Candida] boidinii]GMF66190.1 unnamed protein product [[Candida] boidinii]
MSHAAIKRLVTAAGTKPTHKALSKAQNAYLDRVVRVDQAGELGADLIYCGQYMVLSHTRPELKKIIKHMWEQEVHHRGTFNKFQVARRVRPSLLTPIWKVGALAMGAGTALLGKEGAMACTEAVETVIGKHYNSQLRTLANYYQDVEKVDSKDAALSEELTNLTETIKEFRDDELEHLETAVENDSHGARPYWLITEAIKLTCKTAVWTAERI